MAKKTAKRAPRSVEAEKSKTVTSPRAATHKGPRVIVRPVSVSPPKPDEKAKKRQTVRPVAVEEAAPPPPIKTEAPIGKRRTQYKKPPKDAPVQEVDEEEEQSRSDREKNRRANRQQALDSISPRAARRTRGSKPKASDDEVGVESGSRFVRMFNRAGRVVGVIANYVPERLQEGYRFIEGESVIPTRSGPLDSVPGIKKPTYRDYDRPDSVMDAILLWRDAMLDDAEDMPEEKIQGRDYANLVTRLSAILDNPMVFGRVYGPTPNAEIARALGFGG